MLSVTAFNIMLLSNGGSLLKNYLDLQNQRKKRKDKKRKEKKGKKKKKKACQNPDAHQCGIKSLPVLKD